MRFWSQEAKPQSQAKANTPTWTKLRGKKETEGWEKRRTTARYRLQLQTSKVRVDNHIILVSRDIQAPQIDHLCHIRWKFVQLTVNNPQLTDLWLQKKRLKEKKHFPPHFFSPTWGLVPHCTPPCFLVPQTQPKGTKTTKTQQKHIFCSPPIPEGTARPSSLQG